MLDGINELNKTSYFSTFISSGFGSVIISILVIVLIIAIFLSIKKVNERIAELIGGALITLSIFGLTCTIVPIDSN